MQHIDEVYQQEFSDKLNALFDDNKWQEAKSLLEKEVKKYPEEYFLITSLAKVCYNLKLYKESLKHSVKAMELEPNDVLVIYDYGCALASLDKNSEAIEQWERIIKKDIDEIAYGDFGEGLRWAKSIVNDSRYRMAISALELGNLERAKELIKEHLENRKRGIYSDFTRKQVLEKQTLIK